MNKFNLDERIDTAADLGFVRPDDIEAAREPYKQLIADVLEYVKPERVDDVRTPLERGWDNAAMTVGTRIKELGL